jgi:hypothetical protein
MHDIKMEMSSRQLKVKKVFQGKWSQYAVSLKKVFQGDKILNFSIKAHLGLNLSWEEEQGGGGAPVIAQCHTMGTW